MRPAGGRAVRDGSPPETPDPLPLPLAVAGEPSRADVASVPSGRSLWRRLTAWYGALLSWLLVVAVAVLVIPVSVQIFSRFTALIPHYIWTEEMARFLFVWTIMIGAMLGVRESTHFEVDVWPRVPRRVEAAVKLVARLGVLVVALVFVWSGIEFTRFAWYRISELAELPLWLIHIAWPITGLTWLVFLGEQMWDELAILTGRDRADALA
ncbi:MAG TPA: TRAP transporter small permease [Beijerinckiaceae bacterium]|nr:TRAP transporter small permease [Beijerinckiaceae bacterium]